MSGELKGKKVAILFTDGVEQVEFTKPRDALLEAGATIEVVSIKQDPVQGFNHLDKGDTFPVDRLVSDASVDDYDALMLPGGVANPDFLRVKQGRHLVSRTTSSRRAKPVAAICHGPWTLIDAGVVQGLDRDIVALAPDWTRNAGATWVRPGGRGR